MHVQAIDRSTLYNVMCQCLPKKKERSSESTGLQLLLLLSLSGFHFFYYLLAGLYPYPRHFFYCILQFSTITCMDVRTAFVDHSHGEVLDRFANVQALRSALLRSMEPWMNLILTRERGVERKRRGLSLCNRRRADRCFVASLPRFPSPLGCG